MLALSVCVCRIRLPFSTLWYTRTKNAQYSGDNQHAAHLLCDISVLLSLLNKSVLHSIFVHMQTQTVQPLILVFASEILIFLDI